MPAIAKQRWKARSLKRGDYFPRTLNSFDEKITAVSLITSLYLTKGVYAPLIKPTWNLL